MLCFQRVIGPKSAASQSAEDMSPLSPVQMTPMNLSQSHKLDKHDKVSASNKAVNCHKVRGRVKEAPREAKSRGYSIAMLDLNNTSPCIMVTQRQSKESPKMRGWSDKANVDKPLQTFRHKCDYQCAKERGMKTLNELFEPDTHLREVVEAESLPHWTDLTYQRKRKRSLGWDKKRRAGRLSPLYRSVVMDPGPGLWQGNLIKHAISETRAHPPHARTHTQNRSVKSE